MNDQHGFTLYKCLIGYTTGVGLLVVPKLLKSGQIRKGRGAAVLAFDWDIRSSILEIHFIHEVSIK